MINRKDFNPIKYDESDPYHYKYHIKKKQKRYNELKGIISKLRFENDPRDEKYIDEYKKEIADLEEWVKDEGLVKVLHRDREKGVADYYHKGGGKEKKDWERFTFEEPELDDEKIKELEKSNIDSLEKYPINSIFPKIADKDLKWSDIGLDYCSQDKIQVEIFAVKKKINIVKFGLKNTQNNWKLLFAISSKDGFIDYPTLYIVLETQKNYNVQKNISRLNKHFKNYFGIEENPIFYDYISRCYQTKFLYIRNSYHKKATKLRENDKAYVNHEFEELDENIDF